MLHFMAAFVSAQATCSSTPCAGGNAGCGGNLCLGDGDCDADTDCATGLLCGTDNCGAFRSSAGWPHDGPGWDMTDDCCYSPGGLGSPTPMTVSFHTCDIADGQTNGQTLLHTSETIYLSNNNRNTDGSRTLTSTSPIRAISLTSTGSDGWCVENLRADGVPLDGAAGAWLDNPLQSNTDYPLHDAYVTYTWRVPSPQHTIHLTWHTCDVDNAQSHATSLLHTSETTVMATQTRNVVTTYDVPEGTRHITLTATGSDGWCVEDLKLNGQDPNPVQPRGAWLDSPANGHYTRYPPAVTFTWNWMTVTDRPPLMCNYLPGDGVGGTEANIGHFASAEECAQAVHNSYPVANGATYSAGTPSTGACYAEYGMSHKNDNTAWQTCLFGGWPPIPPSPPPPSPCPVCNTGAGCPTCPSLSCNGQQCPNCECPPQLSCEGSRSAMTANGEDGGVTGGSLALSIILSLGFGACVATGLTYRFMSKRMGGGRGHRGGMRMGMTTPAFNTPISVELSRNGEGARVGLAGADSAAGGYVAPIVGSPM